MKKQTYLKPIMQVVGIQQTHMICGSDGRSVKYGTSTSTEHFVFGDVNENEVDY